MARKQKVQDVWPEDDVVQPDLEGLVGYNLKRAYVVMQKDFRAMMGEGGLSPRVFSALGLVAQFPNISQSELARMLGVERSGLVAIVDELESRSYLQRVKVPGDRRVHALVATQTGLAVYQEMVTAVRAHEERLLSDLTEADKRTLIALLQKIRKDRE